MRRCARLLLRRLSEKVASLFTVLALLVFAAPAWADTWSPTGSLANARYQHTATLLNDGTVLVVGGRIDGSQVISTAEIYQ